MKQEDDVNLARILYRYDGQGIIAFKTKVAQILGDNKAATLFHQVLFWSRQANHKAFYKFATPCEHPLCKSGDSWTEELVMGRDEFEAARDKIATKVGKGDQKSIVLSDTNIIIDEQGKCTNSNHLMTYWTTGYRVTYYEINWLLLASFLDAAFPSPVEENPEAKRENPEAKREIPAPYVGDSHLYSSSNTVVTQKDNNTTY